MSESKGTGSTTRITGGVGAVEAAAIAAVIEQVINDEQAKASTPTNRHRLSDWLMAGRREVFVPPWAPVRRFTNTAVDQP